jgi:hypothetical protein
MASLIHAIYCFSGDRHRIDGPGVVKLDHETRVCTLEAW